MTELSNRFFPYLGDYENYYYGPDREPLKEFDYEDDEESEEEDED